MEVHAGHDVILRLNPWLVKNNKNPGLRIGRFIQLQVSSSVQQACRAADYKFSGEYFFVYPARSWFDTPLLEYHFLEQSSQMAAHKLSDLRFSKFFKHPADSQTLERLSYV